MPRKKTTVEVKTENVSDDTNADIKIGTDNSITNDIKTSADDSITNDRKISAGNSITNDIKTSIDDNSSKSMNDDMKNSILSDILDNITSKKRVAGKTLNIYLSREVAERVEEISKRKKISKSKLVDDILKQVLFNK